MSHPSIRRFLEDKAALTRQIYSSQEWKYSSYDELVLDCGIEMEPIPLPASIQPGVQKQCFWNCQRIIAKRKNLIYVEGYAVPEGISFPVAHAWLMNEQQQAIDPTWETSGIYYLGVPLSSKWIKSVLQSRKKNGKVKDLSIFEGNYLEEYSLLKQGLPPDALVRFDEQGRLI